MNTRWLYDFSAVMMLTLGAWYVAGSVVPGWLPHVKKAPWAVALEGVLWLACATALFEDWWWATPAISLLVLATMSPSYIKERPRDWSR